MTILMIDDLFFSIQLLILFDPKEIQLSGTQYTWANNLKVPTYGKLDGF
jgi:hypothetical protein